MPLAFRRDKNIWGRGKGQEVTEVVTSDLRQLLFWAGVGVSMSTSGTYGNTIEQVIDSYAQHIAFDSFSQPPMFKKQSGEKTK